MPATLPFADPAVRRLAAAAGILLLAAWTSRAVAEPALGTWRTGPDGKAQVAHVEVTTCGPALCGRIARAFDAAGNEIVTPNVGRELFWGMLPLGDGAYGGGRVFVPAHNREYDARMRLSGDRLRVQGCLGPICDGQTWTRVR